MDPELLNALLMGGGGGFPAPMVPPPGMMGGMPAPQGFGNATPLMPQMSQPAPRPIEPYMTDPLMPGTPSPPPIMPQLSQPASLGAMLDPTAPMPRPRPAEAPGGTYAAQSGAGGPQDPSKIFNTLKGVVAPPPPSVQKVGTPHAPQMAKLQGGNVAELLASLGIGPQQAFPGLKLPSTLGQALGG